MTCPFCGSSNVYNSGWTIECPTPKCKNFSLKQLTSSSLGLVENPPVDLHSRTYVVHGSDHLDFEVYRHLHYEFVVVKGELVFETKTVTKVGNVDNYRIGLSSYGLMSDDLFLNGSAMSNSYESYFARAITNSNVRIKYKISTAGHVIAEQELLLAPDFDVTFTLEGVCP